MDFEGGFIIIIGFWEVDLEFSFRFLKAHHNLTGVTACTLSSTVYGTKG